MRKEVLEIVELWKQNKLGIKTFSVMLHQACYTREEYEQAFMYAMDITE